MAFREVSVLELREILRLWVRGKGLRAIAGYGDLDRKTARRYVTVAQELGLQRNGDESQLTEGLVGEVIGRTRPGAPGTPGECWRICEQHRKFLQDRVDEELKLTKVHELLERRIGPVVPYRTLHRFARSELGFGRKESTVRVDDGEPGQELQIDFGRLGYLFEPERGRNRRLWALILTACYSRHQFVWPTFHQSFEDIVEGLEAGWELFGGVFRVLIPDNMKAIVDRADPLHPRIQPRFLDYAQTRGFLVDPARVRRPKDKPRVERAVPYVRNSFFRGEEFKDLADVRNRARQWCLSKAGLRIHGTTQKRPVEVFGAEEQPLLLPAPTAIYDIPVFLDTVVHRDQHIQVGKALYSVPFEYIHQKVHVRADRSLVRISYRGRLIKTHPTKGPGGRNTDPLDYPEHKRVYATRDVGQLRSLARECGESVGAYAERILDGDLLWNSMRLCYRLLGLGRRYGNERLEDACRRALDLDVVDVLRVERMLQRAICPDGVPPSKTGPPGPAAVPRFARPIEEYATQKEARDHE
jgi:transposase